MLLNSAEGTAFLEECFISRALWVKSVSEILTLLGDVSPKLWINRQNHRQNFDYRTIHKEEAKQW